MNKCELIKLLEGLNDDIVIQVSDPNNRTVWYNIECLDTTIEEANEFGQVMLILSENPVSA